MANALHSAQTTSDGIHIPYAWEYADQSTREADSGFVAADVGKFAHQQDNNTIWLLAAITPTWVAVSGAGATGFTDLSDTPSSYSGEGGKGVAVKGAEDGVEFVDFAQDFLDLTDTPSSYSGEGGKLVSVNVGETALEFTSAGVADKADILYLSVKKSTAGTISKGEAIYIAGYSGGFVLVEKAQSDAAGTMPAIGLADGTITDSAAGDVALAGRIHGSLNTSSWSAHDQLYVDPSTAGALTSTKPTGTNLIQKIGEVAYSHATDGEILVSGAGRVNDVPNLAQDYEWEGDSDGVAQAVVRYGASREYAEDDTEDTTTSTTYQQKLRLTTGTLLAGTYRISWSAELGASVKVKNFAVLVELDDTTTINEITSASVSDNDDYTIFSGFQELALTAASHTIDVDYKANEAGVTVAIRRVRISLIRVA
jgi:hypothetical protein